MPIGPAPDWQDISWMVGQYEGTPIIIAVDADGKIINVMQATYAGVLKPVACDAEGRIIMIPTDPADVWGNAISMGNAELAACLTFVKRYDRRGNVVFTEGFENGVVKWGSDTSGANALVSLSTESALSGGYSLKLTAGSTFARYAAALFYNYYFIKGRTGFEYWFTTEDNSEYHGITVDIFDGSNLMEVAIRWDRANSKIQYANNTLAWTDLATGVNYAAKGSLYLPMKLVIDSLNVKYTRLLFNEREIDMSTIAAYSAPASTMPQVIMNLSHYGASGVNAVSYVDNVIITQNEPA